MKEPGVRYIEQYEICETCHYAVDGDCTHCLCLKWETIKCFDDSCGKWRAVWDSPRKVYVGTVHADKLCRALDVVEALKYITLITTTPDGEGYCHLCIDEDYVSRFREAMRGDLV